MQGNVMLSAGGKEPHSRLDFLSHYLGIDEKRWIEYEKAGKGEQLHRIAIRLYHRHYRIKFKNI